MSQEGGGEGPGSLLGSLSPSGCARPSESMSETGRTARSGRTSCQARGPVVRAALGLSMAAGLCGPALCPRRVLVLTRPVIAVVPRAPLPDTDRRQSTEWVRMSPNAA